MRFLAILLCAASLFPTTARAAEDLLETYRAAKSFDPVLRAAQYEYEATTESAPQAFADLLPQVGIDLRYSTVEQNILSRDNQFLGAGDSRYKTTAYSFQATQPVFRMASWIQLKQAKAVVRQAEAQYAFAEQDLMVRATELYLTLLAARDTYDFARAELAAVAKLRDLVQARRRGGLASVTDEYEAQARYSLVEAAVIEARYGFDDAYQALREAVGDAVSDILPLKSEIPLVAPVPAEVSVWMDKALEQNYSLIALKEAENVAKDEVRRQRSGHLPTLDVVARHGNTDQGGSVSTGASDVDTTEVSLQVTVPIFAGGAVNSRTRQAHKRFLKASEDRKAAHRAIMRRTRAAFQGVLTGIRRIQALQASELSQQSVLEGKQRGYRSGASTLLDMLDAERDLYSIRRDLAVARYTYLLNMLRLKQQAGTLSEADIAYVNTLVARQDTQASLQSSSGTQIANVRVIPAASVAVSNPVPRSVSQQSDSEATLKQNGTHSKVKARKIVPRTTGLALDMSISLKSKVVTTDQVEAPGNAFANEPAGIE